MTTSVVTRVTAAILVAGTGLFCQLPARAQTTAAVTVTAGANLATIPSLAFGVNTAVWDGDLLDAAVPGLLAGVGASALRYPGGSTSDIYNWQSASIVPGQSGYAFPANTFDAFMGIASGIGAAPIITINYGSNATGDGGATPASAAAWVQYSNVTKGYGVKYWEIGNEIYGNGEYAPAWETDLHSAHDPATYGANVVQFAAAMKAVDPTIKVGAVLAAPGNWPDGQSPDWNSNVLAQCGGVIDFVVVHWYPESAGWESDSGLLATPRSGIGGSPGIAAMMATLKSLIARYAGANAANVQILVTETNSVPADPGKQTISIVNAMFMADNMLTWLENGATSVDVWDLHNISTAGNTSSSLYGTSTFGDYGILSNHSSGEPAADTTFPTYYGIQMLTNVGKAGDTLVTAASSNPLLTAHAALQANGSLALLLINKDPANVTTATVSIAGFTPQGGGTVFTYGESSTAITSSAITVAGNSFTLAASPYSLTTILLAPSGGAVAPPAGHQSSSNPPPPAPGPASFSGTASVDSIWFAEDDVVLTTNVSISALTLTITVPASNTSTVSYNNLYNTIGPQIGQSDVSGPGIVYTFTLANGGTIWPGKYTFAGQMNGNGQQPHLASGDTWTVTYTVGGLSYTQSGAI